MRDRKDMVMIAGASLAALVALGGAGDPYRQSEMLKIRAEMKGRFRDRGPDPVQMDSPWAKTPKHRDGGKRQMGKRFKGSKAAKRAARRGGNPGKRS